ncbi:elongator complex protein 4-like [Diadema setosum]|uniref:elongator complex protein 4-like n=1 Tax=Diadema setosum TaxID=31175 RepID=UPI003B3A8A78
MAAPMEAKTSFQRKSKSKTIAVRGTRPSLHNGQLLVSTGVPSLDHLLGGGLAVGTVLLVEEDTFGSYASLLLRYFLAEGIMSGHGLMVASAEEQPKKLLKRLPRPLEDDQNQASGGKSNPSAQGERTPAGTGEQMKIAWRYQHLPQHQIVDPSNQFGHSYDISRTIEEGRLGAANCSCFHLQTGLIGQATDSECEGISLNPAYRSLFGDLEKAIEEGGYSLTPAAVKAQSSTDRSVLRIGLHSLASPLWEVGGSSGSHGDGQACVDLCRFLHALRGLLRVSLAACVVTMPTHLFQDGSTVRKVERLCDSAVLLESFAGSDMETNPAYKEYHGLFHIRKLPRLNSLTACLPDSVDLAFKLRRKKLTIEKLHLPPDLSETVSRSQEDPAKLAARSAAAGAFSCASSLSDRKLDF